MATNPMPPAPKGRKASSRTAKRSNRDGRFVTVGFATGPALPPGVVASTRLKKAGGSLVATVPAAARHMLHLTEGQELAVKVEGSKLTMEPMPKATPQRVRRPRYTLDELVAGMEPAAAMSDDEKAWNDAPAAGREVW